MTCELDALEFVCDQVHFLDKEAQTITEVAPTPLFLKAPRTRYDYAWRCLDANQWYWYFIAIVWLLALCAEMHNRTSAWLKLWPAAVIHRGSFVNMG